MNNLESRLNKVDRLAKAGRLSRLLASPVKYAEAMLLLKFIYPITRKGSLKRTSLFFGGDMQVLLPAATDIYLTGGKTHSSEIRLARFMIKNLQHGHTYLDIGAHFGYFTLLAASLVGNKGKVYSIEAAKGTYGLLAANVNGNENINVFHHAVSDKDEWVSFYEFPVLYSEYNALNVDKFEQEAWMQKHKPEKTKVQAVTIDGFLEEWDAVPDMIKIDVEGAEVQAIKGGMHTWQSQQPVIIMEYLSDDSSYNVATDMLLQCGYTTYIINDAGELEQVKDIPAWMQEHNTTSENVVFKKNNK